MYIWKILCSGFVEISKWQNSQRTQAFEENEMNGREQKWQRVTQMEIKSTQLYYTMFCM